MEFGCVFGLKYVVVWVFAKLGELWRIHNWLKEVGGFNKESNWVVEAIWMLCEEKGACKAGKQAQKQRPAFRINW